VKLPPGKPRPPWTKIKKGEGGENVLLSHKQLEVNGREDTLALGTYRKERERDLRTYSGLLLSTQLASLNVCVNRRDDDGQGEEKSKNKNSEAIALNSYLISK